MTLPEDGARPDGDGWIIGTAPAPAPVRRRAWRPSRRLILAVTILVALIVLIAAAPAAATIVPTRPPDAVCRCGDRPPISQEAP